MSNGSMVRDPMINPQRGDVIQQYSGHLVRVVTRDGDQVSWVSKTQKGKEWGNHNYWTLKGWRNVVCDRAAVVSKAGESDGDV